MQYSQKYPEEGVAPLMAEEPAIAYPRVTAPRLAGETEQTFQTLFAEWERNVGPFSNTNRLKSDPTFKRIVSMGEQATPYLYSMLQEGNFAAVLFCEEIYQTRLLPPERFSFKAIADNSYPTSTELIGLWLSHLSK